MGFLETASFVSFVRCLLEGHSSQGLHSTLQTEVGRRSLHLRGRLDTETMLVSGSELLKRPKLNCIDFLQSHKLLILFKRLSVCFLMSSGEDTLELSRPENRPV